MRSYRRAAIMMVLAALCSCEAPEKKVEKAAVQPGAPPKKVETAAVQPGAPEKKVEEAVAQPGAPPKGAIVLFAGKDTSAWEGGGGKPVGWKLLDDGSMEVVPKSGSISTKQKFTDFQLHVEFWLPKLAPEVKSQARANSGVFLQGRYEIQVLDSYHNDTYAMGGCGAIYKKKEPDHFDQAVRPPETWNTYDVTFRAARFDAAGKKTENARVTVLWNGVKVHDNVEITGPTSGKNPNEPAASGPIMLQDHNNRVRYRNIWIVPMGEGEKK